MVPATSKTDAFSLCLSLSHTHTHTRDITEISSLTRLICPTQLEQHMIADLNPDGTLFVKKDNVLIWGSHMTSFSRAIFDACGPVLHVPRALNEEKNVRTVKPKNGYLCFYLVLI